MKEINYKFNYNLPYGLHDRNVKNISINEDTITLDFKDGLTKLIEPYDIVKGKIEILKADLDFSNVDILNEYGNYGEIKGEKLDLKEFIEKYKEYNFEITDELYSYNQVWYSGYITFKGSYVPKEITISIYHFGDILYKVE